MIAAADNLARPMARGMKIALMSDLHLEFEKISDGIRMLPEAGHPAHPLEGFWGRKYMLGPDLRALKAARPDIVILAGDIALGGGSRAYANAVARYLETRVVFIPGNHEFYGSTIEWVTLQLSERAGRAVFADNTVLNENRFGVRFLFTTLWTNFDNNPPMLNDFRTIGYRGKYLQPRDTQQFHKDAVAWLDNQLSTPWDGKTVVVTHHVPSMRQELLNPHYEVTRLTRAFHAELDDLIAHYKPDAWLFGHHHWCLDITIDGTRFVSNQRGYPKENTGGFDAAKIIVV